MTIKVLRDHFIFILAIISFLTSCQMTNTGEKNISVLDKELGIEELVGETTTKSSASEELDDLQPRPSYQSVCASQAHSNASRWCASQPVTL